MVSVNVFSILNIMHTLLTILLYILVAIAAFVALLIWSLFSATTHQTNVEDHIKDLETFLGRNNLIKDYEIVEYNYKEFHGDQPLSLIIKLSSDNYQNLFDLISNHTYENKNIKTKESSKLWHVGMDGFNFISESCLNFEESRRIVNITGITNGYIVKYSSCYY